MILLSIVLCFFSWAGVEIPAFDIHKPADFDQFWAGTVQELKRIPLDAEIAPNAKESNSKVECAKVSYTSLKNIRVYAWYCRPKKEGAFAGLIINPWFGREQIEAPRQIAQMGYAVLSYQGRGYPVDLKKYPSDNTSYAVQGIESPYAYVYREMVSHGLRGIDFLASRPEVDPHRIGAAGSSQGGGLSLILAGLDSRISAVVADFPFLAAISLGMKAPEGMYPYWRDFINQNPQKKELILTTLGYFDSLHFADKITVPVLVNVGLKDKLCPPEAVRFAYAQIASLTKTLRVFPRSGHSSDSGPRAQATYSFLNQQLKPWTSGKETPQP